MNSAVPGFEAVPFNALLTKLHIPNLAGAFYKCPTDAPKLTGYSDIPCRQIQLGIWIAFGVFTQPQALMVVDCNCR